jgi:hypothetical protein
MLLVDSVGGVWGCGSNATAQLGSVRMCVTGLTPGALCRDWKVLKAVWTLEGRDSQGK